MFENNEEFKDDRSYVSEEAIKNDSDVEIINEELIDQIIKANEANKFE